MQESNNDNRLNITHGMQSQMLHTVRRRRIGRFVGINGMAVASSKGDILPFMFELVHEGAGIKRVRTETRQ